MLNVQCSVVILSGQPNQCWSWALVRIFSNGIRSLFRKNSNLLFGYWLPKSPCRYYSNMCENKYFHLCIQTPNTEYIVCLQFVYFQLSVYFSSKFSNLFLNDICVCVCVFVQFYFIHSSVCITAKCFWEIVSICHRLLLVTSNKRVLSDATMQTKRTAWAKAKGYPKYCTDVLTVLYI